MQTIEWLTVAVVLATVLGPLITWLVMKRQFASKRLSYTYEIVPLLNSDADLARDLKVFYKDEELPQPALLTLTISNTGHTAIEMAEVIVQLPGPTYLIPGDFLEMPPGYLHLWDIDRTDAEECTIRFKHINPKQVARVRLLMDEIPNGAPLVSCPMANVQCVRGTPVSVGMLAEFVVKAVAPQLLRI
ncbi:hypothetical protein RCH14_000110 [Massilia sp. MP_M2]|uniref:hypothetical protein n=1 Tax=Massilia sp. MP_M2 TaxID=3071713 RepID=UPI00319E1267